VLVQFASLFSLLTAPLRVISYLLFDFPRSLVGYTRVRRVLDEPIRAVARSGTEELPAGPLALEVRDVSFKYAEAPVLEHLDLTVPAGHTLAIVGATGAGKSTLTQLLVRLADPQEGVVAIGGLDLRTVSTASIRRDVAVVFQESFLFASSVRDNIALGLDVTQDAIEQAARLAQAHRFITRLPEGYDTVMGERGVTLSGGQRQRVALARALVRRPRVLILDDATSAVDPTVEARILDGLRQELQTTLVVVAYRNSTISLADQVAFVADGRVLATGTHVELLAGVPAYESMVRAYELAAERDLEAAEELAELAEADVAGGDR
jgi:ABC-type multidrug transport system fused ATPase/permease subunit